MLRISMFCLLLVSLSFAKAQTPIPDTAKIDNILDDDILNFLDSIKKPTSYFTLALGLGNKFFSVKNNSINSSQAEVNKLYLTTALSYTNKSGFGLSVMPYISNANGSLKIYQTAVTPSYNVAGKNIDFNISYTRYLADYKSYNSNATYQNDFFTSGTYTKGYLEPSLSLGYTSGKFKEANIIPIQLQNRIVYVKDSTNNNIKNYSVSAAIEHIFNFEKILNSNGELSLIPQLLVIAGSQSFSAKHTNKNYDFFLKKSTRFKSRTKTANEPFNLQSLAFSFDVSYRVGKFFLSPNLYLDYYLPATTGKKFTTVYSVSAGISF